MTIRSNQVNWTKKAHGWPWQFLPQRDRRAIPPVRVWLDNREIKHGVRAGIESALQDSYVVDHFRQMHVPAKEFAYLIVNYFAALNGPQVEREDLLLKLKRNFLRKTKRKRILQRVREAEKLVVDLELLTFYANRVHEMPVRPWKMARTIEREIASIEMFGRTLKNLQSQIKDTESYLQRKPEISLGVGGSPGQRHTALIISLRNFLAHFSGETRPARSSALIVRVLDHFAIHRDVVFVQKLLAKYPVSAPFFTRPEFSQPASITWVPASPDMS